MTKKKKYDFIRSVVKQVHSAMDNHAMDFFLNGLSERTLDKNEIYIDTSRTHYTIGFIVKGLIRGYYLDDKGNEINTRFLKEGDFVTHYKAFISQEPSNYFFKTIETTV